MAFAITRSALPAVYSCAIMARSSVVKVALPRLASSARACFTDEAVGRKPLHDLYEALDDAQNTSKHVYSTIIADQSSTLLSQIAENYISR